MEYVILACNFALLAIAINLMAKFDAQAWLAKGLKRGDLSSLVDVASGLRPDGLGPDQANRLLARGLVRAHGNGHFYPTIKGRLALRIRRKVRRRSRMAA